MVKEKIDGVIRNFFPYKRSMKTPDMIEQLFIEEESAAVEKRGWTHTFFGNAVFGHEGGRIWRTARDPQGLRNKHRKIGIAEGYKMAQLLEIDFSSLIWKIEQKMNAEKEKG